MDHKIEFDEWAMSCAFDYTNTEYDFAKRIFDRMCEVVTRPRHPAWEPPQSWNEAQTPEDKVAFIKALLEDFIAKGVYFFEKIERTGDKPTYYGRPALDRLELVRMFEMIYWAREVMAAEEGDHGILCPAWHPGGVCNCSRREEININIGDVLEGYGG